MGELMQYLEAICRHGSNIVQIFIQEGVSREHSWIYSQEPNIVSGMS